jgi:hypothetical protein
MLVHFFWLLEFKFKFEFYCLNPFQTQTLIPKPYPIYPTFQPSSQRPNPRSRRPQQQAATRSPRALQPS